MAVVTFVTNVTKKNSPRKKQKTEIPIFLKHKKNTKNEHINNRNKGVPNGSTPIH